MSRVVPHAAGSSGSPRGNHRAALGDRDGPSLMAEAECARSPLGVSQQFGSRTVPTDSILRHSKGRALVQQGNGECRHRGTYSHPLRACPSPAPHSVSCHFPLLFSVLVVCLPGTSPDIL